MCGMESQIIILKSTEGRSHGRTHQTKQTTKRSGHSVATMQMRSVLLAPTLGNLLNATTAQVFASAAQNASTASCCPYDTYVLVEASLSDAWMSYSLQKDIRIFG